MTETNMRIVEREKGQRERERVTFPEDKGSEKRDARERRGDVLRYGQT